MRKRFLKSTEINFSQLRFGVKHKVEATAVRGGNAKLIFPHDFPESSFAAIANYGAAYFPRSRDSISPLTGVILQKEGRKEGSVNFVTVLINLAILLAVAQRLHLNNGSG